MAVVAGFWFAGFQMLPYPERDEVARELVEKNITPSVPAVIFKAGARVAEVGIWTNSVEVRYPRVLAGLSLVPIQSSGDPVQMRTFTAVVGEVFVTVVVTFRYDASWPNEKEFMTCMVTLPSVCVPVAVIVP
jgi:hypothetical protein